MASALQRLADPVSLAVPKSKSKIWVHCPYTVTFTSLNTVTSTSLDTVTSYMYFASWI